MAAAYAYADGGPVSPEIRLIRSVDRFGAQAVFGRTLSAKEIKQMLIADAIVEAYHARARSKDWAAWETDNPERATLLNAAMKLAIEAE